MKLFTSILFSFLVIAALIYSGCNQEPTAPVNNTPTMSKLILPAGAVISTATFNIYVEDVQNHVVDVHKVNVPWDEATETYNTFIGKPAPQFDPAILGSFNAGTQGYKSVDITSLVQGWINGSIPNNGVLLDQAIIELGLEDFWSKEHAGGIVAPYLEITYTVNGGAPVTVQEKASMDTWVWNLEPNTNYGSNELLVLGRQYIDYIKYVLVKFDVTQQSTVCGTGYAYGGNLATAFCGLAGAGSNNWGWTQYITTNTNYSLDWPIYVGAGQCDITKGTLVGTFHLNYNATTDQLVLTYDLLSGYTASEVHIWIGDTKLPLKQNGSWNFAPGQFNYQNPSFPFQITRANNFWIAAHFGICWGVNP